ncbi:hypothetical protein [Dyadobacter sp. CY356]|uniref:hypothetical protein n=1 Tax=Dyadobacter sp. CY356 TaxID=2906442 RepID=UPI001F235480|nr:hypothetical protein [Dyadobacter sp. CY356]MCF0054629.1 hypothetical protein [Dyadobacter sp. CY356]
MKITTLSFVISCLIFSACNNSPKPILAPEYILENPDMHPITSVFNKKNGTTSTLYGNDLVLKAARNENKSHNAGEVFTLITSELKPNPYWFGGNINGAVKYTETVKVLADENGTRVVYEAKNNGSDVMKKVGADKQARINFIFDQKAAVFP